jgi:hypothetical protein
LNVLVECLCQTPKKHQKILNIKEVFKGINEENELSISTQPKEHSMSICSQDKEEMQNKQMVHQESIKNLYVTRLIFT